MTSPDAPASGEETSGSTTETPGYTSPTEQLLQSLPFGIFRTLAERLGSTKGGGGGRFEFSVDEMRELHRQFSDEAEALKQMSIKSFNASTNLQPLAPDDASMKHFMAAQDHYGKLDGAIEQQLAFAEGFRDAVGAAIGLKSDDEESIGGGFRKIGRAVES